MYEFVISPEPFLEKCRSLARVKNPCLEVAAGRVRLAWKDGDTVGFMERADLLGLGITDDMLEDALSEAGGTLDLDGRYSLNEPIRQRLRKLLNAK